MRNSDINAKLAEAIKARSIVRLTRKVEAGHADGYVVATSDQWLLLLLIGEGVTYAGFQAVRIRDVSSLQMPSPYASFYQTALRKRRLRRPATPKLNLSSTQELVQSAGTRFPLVTVHREKADPGVCHIGSVVSVSPTSVSILEITPHATWEESPAAYRLAQVTRVDVGGPYEEALLLVATANTSVKGPGLRPAPYFERSVTEAAMLGIAARWLKHFWLSGGDPRGRERFEGMTIVETAKRVLEADEAVRYGIFGVISTSGYFPPLRFLNEFFMVGSDPCDQDGRMGRWVPFTLSIQEYNEVKTWWEGRYPGAVTSELGVASWEDWAQVILNPEEWGFPNGLPRPTEQVAPPDRSGG